MTDELGRHWRQPATSEIRLGFESARMTRETFDRLAEYSYTLPTGVYPGKMWRFTRGDRHWLMWYGREYAGRCGVHSREIVIL